MKQSLHEQNEQIIRLSAEKREAIAGIDQEKKIMIDDLYAEIARLRQAVQLLNQRLSEHEFSQGLGYL